MVFKRYVKQLFLDGLQRKGRAYPCKTDLIPRKKPGRFSIFLKNAAISRICCQRLKLSSLVSSARARDLRSHFSAQAAKRIYACDKRQLWAFPVCTLFIRLFRFNNYVVRITLVKLVVTNQQPQMKEKKTTNTSKVCGQ